jgi:DNA invertase Pin-like site-specific DNA recombinase
MKIGYARVSTTGQSYDIQEQKLREAGCERVMTDKRSGKTTEGRDGLQDVLEFIRDGDTLVVTKLDRLARSVSDITKIVEKLEAKGADLVVLDNSGIDTTTPQGKLIFHILAAVGELERSLITERTAEGREKAMREGVKFGRKEVLTPAQLVQLRTDAESFSGSKADLGRKYGISRATVYRLLADQVVVPAMPK